MYEIAIIGAGPAGATFARLLLTSTISSSVKITVFEKDANQHSRFFLGGTLDLHPQTGLAAIDKANLWKEFRKHARYEGEEMRICDKNGTVYVHSTEVTKTDGKNARPEIDREDLKEMLVNSLPAHIIRWGKHLKSVDADKKTLTFADGSTEGPFDLIVGADGAWSKVRNVITTTKPTYSGICSMRVRVTPDTCPDKETWEHVSSMVGKGNNFTFSDQRGFQAQRLGSGDVSVGLNFRTDDLDWSARVIADTNGDEAAICQRVLSTWYKDWDESYLRWFPCMTRFQPWTLYELPVGHRWDHVPGFTVIGDAAHLTTPFAGEGANAAMRDAVELAAALERALSKEGHESVEKEIAGFEADMFQRAKGFMARTLANKRAMFTGDSPYTFLAHMAGVIARGGFDKSKGWTAFVPIQSIVYAVFWTVGTFGVARRHVREWWQRR